MLSALNIPFLEGWGQAAHLSSPSQSLVCIEFQAVLSFSKANAWVQSEAYNSGLGGQASSPRQPSKEMRQGAFLPVPGEATLCEPGGHRTQVLMGLEGS